MSRAGLALLLLAAPAAAQPPARQTAVSIHGDKFLINGQPTYKGRTWNGNRIEGLLMNSRMVQATFDDLNPDTRGQWKYPDTGTWDADRNTREFVAALPTYRKHGLLAVTVNLQGGSPQGYSKEQPWHNSAFTAGGSLRPEYVKRMDRVIEACDRLGMAVILGLFYFGQDERLESEDAVRRGVNSALDWLHDRGYTNVLIEINNEADLNYDHPVLTGGRVHELIDLVKSRQDNGRRFLVGTSFRGGSVPTPAVVKSSDFVLLHGNGVREPAGIADLVRRTRQTPGYRPMPILFNEDDHFDFDNPVNHFTAAVGEYASWGYFDYRMKGEGFADGYQSVPVDWGINSPRKRGFFKLLSEITGEKP
jgi:hypothetical protein